MITERSDSGQAAVAVEFDQVLKSFDHPPVDRQDYPRFSKIKQFLKSRIQDALEQVKGNVDAWMAILNYKNKTKLLRRIRDTWPGLKAPIPRRFLGIIGVSVEYLSRLMRTEKKLFIEALARAKVPSTFSYRLIPAIYGVEDLPAGMSEPEAIQYVQRFLTSSGLTSLDHLAIITFGGIKQVAITVDSSKTTIFPPQMKVTPRQVTFSTEILGYTSQVM